MLRLRIPIALLAILTGIGQAEQVVTADTIPLIVDIDSSSTPMRTTGPIPMSVRVQWTGPPAILEGDLQFQITDMSGDLTSVSVLPDLHLTEGTQYFQFLLPPVESDHWDSQFTVRTTFVSERGRFLISEQNLTLRGVNSRTLVLRVATNRDSLKRDELDEIEGTLALDRWFRALPGAGEKIPMRTLTSPIDVADLPTLPLQHCVQDLLVIWGDALGKLSEQQRAAIVGWVRGGGRLCVAVDESPFNSEDVDLLHELLGKRLDSGFFSRTTSGELLWPENASLLTNRFGWGTVLVTKVDDITRQANSRKWREALCLLWDLREDQKGSILRNGFLSLDVLQTLRNEQVYGDNRELDRMAADFRPQPISGGTGLLQATLPSGMQLVPLWLMGLTLMLYILAIGPAEWIGLGKLRLRRLTWVTFPLTTLVFAGGAIALSNVMMAGRDNGGSVTFIDVTEDGLVARENRIQLHFSSSSGRQEVPLTNALYSPVSHRKLGAADVYQLQQAAQADAARVPPVVQGTLPVRATIVENVDKWTPRLARTLTIPAEPRKAPSNFDWTLPVNPRIQRHVDELGQKIREAFPGDVHAQLFRRNCYHDREVGPEHEADEADDRTVLLGVSEIITSPYELSQVRVARLGQNGTVR
ncbi:MAG: hypothetical protein KDA80_15200, partial [Planctomycetaceae bacterium]|nr:hypothetical protein [Planctomycetaceae bacterium]